MVRITSGTCGEILESDLLRRVSSVEADNIGGAGLERLLHSVVEDEDCQVNCLSIGGDLTSLHPDLLSQAVVRLDRINLDRARLEGEQVKVMLTKVRDHPQLSLTTLSLDRSHGYPLQFTALHPRLLSAALLRLESVSLWGDILSTDQLSQLFLTITTLQLELLLARIVSTRSPLRGLYIGDNNLASVSPTLLAQAVVELQTVSLDDTNLSREQVTALLAGISQCDHTKLRHLDMLGLNIDIDISLPADIRQRLEQKFKVVDGFRQIRLELI